LFDKKTVIQGQVLKVVVVSAAAVVVVVVTCR
jgi:hypothetical protein